MKRAPKKTDKKLELSRRNIRRLNKVALDQAAGGIKGAFPSFACTGP